VPGQRAPSGPGVSDDRLTSTGFAQRADVDAACVLQVGLGDVDAGGGGEELPRQGVNGAGPQGCGRLLGCASGPRDLTRDGRRRAVEGGARLEGLDGAGEGESGEPVDVLDDVTAGPAPEAVEPVGYTADRQGRRGVVVEGAAAHEPLTPPGQLDPAGGHDDLDAVVMSDRGNVKAGAVGNGHGWIPQPS